MFSYHFSIKKLFNIIVCLIGVTSGQPGHTYDTQGPQFSIEPSHHLQFINTHGGHTDCTGKGNPMPNVEWFDIENNPVTTIPKIRQILMNGTLYFPPFSAEAFRQDVHWSTYKCILTNTVGKILSRDVHVKAVVNQRYEPEVQNPGGFLYNNIILRCNIPAFVKDYVKVTSWLQEPNFNIYPSLESDGKYHMLPTGELLIINVTRKDAQKSYRCRTHHQLTQEAVVSSNSGQIQLTEMSEPVPPIMNEKLIKLTVKQGETIIIPCVAYASPRPTYQWYRKHNGNIQPINIEINKNFNYFNINDNNGNINIDNNINNNDKRLIIIDDTLRIMYVNETDTDLYYCTAKNSVGSETLEINLLIIDGLTVNVQPIRQTIDLGKTALLTCTVTGLPQTTIYWLKDGQPLRSGSRVRLLNNFNIKITSVTKEDRGMYQCFVKNDNDFVQGSAELRLGEVAPQLVYKFIEQTMQPGPTVSLKCSATGNPTPQITWLLDGFPLPNNDRLLIGQYVTVFGDVISHVNITAVKSEDGGEYECVARSRAGTSNHAARLNIYGMPFVRSMSPISATAGKMLTIKCPVAGYPIEMVLWEKVPPKITPFQFARDLNVGDRTSVQCVVATGDLPLTFHWLKDDKLILPLNGTTMTTGTGYTIIGNSTTGIYDGGTINIRQNDEFTSALSIMNIATRQAGMYTCRVQNDADTILFTAQLKVNVPPRISPFNFDDDITEGMRTQLMCSSSQGDQPFNITWLRDLKPIVINNLHIDNHNGEKMLLSPPPLVTAIVHQQQPPSIQPPTITINDYTPFSSILTILNVTSHHNGNYTCQIENRAGIVHYTAVLSVSVPPRWIIEPTDESAVLGNTVTISCKADGFPQPTIHWKQAIGEQSGEYRELTLTTENGTNQNMNHNNNGIENTPNGTLIIRKVTRDHEGYFLCQASNGIGAGLSKLILLTVHVGPNVIVRNKHVSVRRGERITLRCEADGDQPLEVSWRAKGNRIDFTYDVRYHLKNSPLSRGIVSELTIVQTTLVDRGEYSCIATNTYGHDHATIHLQVQEPPNFPRNLHINDLGSRSVLLAWTIGSNEDEINGEHVNGFVSDSQPVDNFILQFKEGQDVWHEHNNQKKLPGDKTVALINNLKPATNYHFRLFAENHLGTSAPSDILNVNTDTEVPSGSPQKVTIEPLGAQQLLVTWRAPERDLWNGDLLGYTVGYHKIGTSDQNHNYTRVGIPGGETINDFRLTGLEKFTQYGITIQAFNIKGDGPPSELIIAQTLEDVPSSPPQNVKCASLTSQNIQVSWHPPPKDNIHGIIQGYKLLYEPLNVETENGLRETKVTSALSTVLHGLQPFTNYTVQVLCYTRAGEGILSTLMTCTTDEAVPDAPERVKAVVNSENSVIISWLPPRRPNGIVTKYTVFIRILEKGQEVKIINDILLAQNHHYEAKDLNSHETHEAWVTASTKIGQGPSTPVIKLSPSVTIAAAIVSFGQTLSVAWRVDVKLACKFVGSPRPASEWKVLDSRTEKQQPSQHRLEIANDNTLTLRNVQRVHQGNYSCYVRNALGSDHIVYQLFVQVPPLPPKLICSPTTTTSVTLQWFPGDNGGSSLLGYLLSYRREFGDWEELQLDRRISSYLLDNLQCGTRYQFTLAAFNKIGSGSSSNLESVRTKGNKPTSPRKKHFINVNTTSIILELTAWQDGGCSIIYFSVEYRRHGYINDWIVVSSNIPLQLRYQIGDLEPSTAYNLRITAHNNAGATIAEYFFETLSLTGTAIINTNQLNDTENNIALFYSSHFVTICIIVLFLIILIICSLSICIKLYGRTLFTNHERDHDQPEGLNISGLNLESNKNSTLTEHREQFYATVRKQQQQQQQQHQQLQHHQQISPCHDNDPNSFERIPEYSEDIYPYATFHLPADHENMSSNTPANSTNTSCIYDSAKITKQIRPIPTPTPSTTPSGPPIITKSHQQQQRCIKGNVISSNLNNRGKQTKQQLFKTESEEYDSLGSDTDNDRAETSLTVTKNDLITFNSGHAHSPGPRMGKEQRLTLLPRSMHHSVQYSNHETKMLLEKLQIYK